MEDPQTEFALSERRAELARNLQTVQERIASATRRVGRSDLPQLIVVTKFHPLSDIVLLHSLGVRNFGESREQEATSKARALAEMGLVANWNFIGQLQSKKVPRVMSFARAIHSLDRSSQMDALARQDRQPPVEVFIQVDLAGEVRELPSTPEGKSRGGIVPGELFEFAERLQLIESVSLKGIMAVAPLGESPDDAFSLLQDLSNRLKQRIPEADEISAGMSTDLESAVRFGATRLRIGSDVLGPRPTLR